MELPTYKTPSKLRAYKRKYMAKRRAIPEINEKIKARTRKWYVSSGRNKRQKEYLTKMREEQFMKWRTKLFNQHHRTNYKESDLQEIWDRQKGLCYFTGQKLDNTANLDHIVPLKRNGTDELSNLRWITKQVNFMKRDMLDEEFLNVVEAIVKCFSPL